MTYEIKQRRKGWFWIHRKATLAVAVPIAILGWVAEYFYAIAFPFPLLFGAAALVSVIEILYVSMVRASPRDASEVAL